jgi:hypothetical protein
MKKCTYCGQEYSDEYSICPIDENPLESFDPTRPRPQETPTVRRLQHAHRAMRPHTKAALISGACVISMIAATVLIEGLAQGISSGYGVLAILGCFLAIKVIFFVAYVAFIVQGFRVYWGWGLANLILGPLAGIVFFLKHRQEARVPIYVLIHGLILLSIFILFAFVKAPMG